MHGQAWATLTQAGVGDMAVWGLASSMPGGGIAPATGTSPTLSVSASSSSVSSGGGGLGGIGGAGPLRSKKGARKRLISVVSIKNRAQK